MGSAIQQSWLLCADLALGGPFMLFWLQALVHNFRSDLSIRLRDIAKKTGSREAETDSM